MRAVQALKGQVCDPGLTGQVNKASRQPIRSENVSFGSTLCNTVPQDRLYRPAWFLCYCSGLWQKAMEGNVLSFWHLLIVCWAIFIFPFFLSFYGLKHINIPQGWSWTSLKEVICQIPYICLPQEKCSAVFFLISLIHSSRSAQWAHLVADMDSLTYCSKGLVWDGTQEGSCWQH